SPPSSRPPSSPPVPRKTLDAAPRNVLYSYRPLVCKEGSAMARNRHPEATVERILAEAARLFLQKGYEKTSMQDIMEGTGLSKGAIYHHFSSKEDILLRIGGRMGEENAAALQRVLDTPGLNGAQK